MKIPVFGECITLAAPWTIVVISEENAALRRKLNHPIHGLAFSHTFPTGTQLIVESVTINKDTNVVKFCTWMGRGRVVVTVSAQSCETITCG